MSTDFSIRPVGAPAALPVAHPQSHAASAAIRTATTHSGWLRRRTARINEYLDMDLSAGDELTLTALVPMQKSARASELRFCNTKQNPACATAAIARSSMNGRTQEWN